MSVLFRSSDSDVIVEVGEYQEISEHAARAEATHTESPAKPKSTHFSVVLVSFGLLCVLQAALNIALRLSLRQHHSISESTNEGETLRESCPPGWLEFGLSCYYISSERRGWNESREYCWQRGADLVIIDSRQEQAFLTGFTKAAWIGMTDREKEGTWLWVDGSPVDKDSLMWAPGQPDDAYGGEDCGDIRMQRNFIGLNDFNCTGNNRWICEKEMTVA